MEEITTNEIWNKKTLARAAGIAKRNNEIIQLRRMGLTLQQIGEIKGLTHERIRQILDYARKHGVDVSKRSRPTQEPTP